MDNQKPKSVQIPSDLFYLLTAYFEFSDVFPDDFMSYLEDKIKNGLQAKLDAMERREIFSKYKTSVPGNEREQLRKKYLELAGISPNWQSEIEMQP